ARAVRARGRSVVVAPRFPRHRLGPRGRRFSLALSPRSAGWNFRYREILASGSGLVFMDHELERVLVPPGPPVEPRQMPDDLLCDAGLASKIRVLAREVQNVPLVSHGRYGFEDVTWEGGPNVYRRAYSLTRLAPRTQ